MEIKSSVMISTASVLQGVSVPLMSWLRQVIELRPRVGCWAQPESGELGEHTCSLHHRKFGGAVQKSTGKADVQRSLRTVCGAGKREEQWKAQINRAAARALGDDCAVFSL